MPKWDADQYLRFGEPRTQVSRDLARRVLERLPSPRRIVDLGCGPGNSTEVLHVLFPHAERILGLDASAEMLAAARRRYPRFEFETADIAAWAAAPESGAWDLVFSNSALHWLADHATLIPRLFARVAPGGVLAFQMPSAGKYGVDRIARELVASPAFRDRIGPIARAWDSQELEFYYDLLAPLAAEVELWETDYLVPMAGAEAITDWYKGSGLRPILEALPDDAARADFLRDYTEAIRRAYPAQPSGVILFRMRRRFVLAKNRTGA